MVDVHRREAALVVMGVPEGKLLAPSGATLDVTLGIMADAPPPAIAGQRNVLKEAK